MWEWGACGFENWISTGAFFLAAAFRKCAKAKQPIATHSVYKTAKIQAIKYSFCAKYNLFFFFLIIRASSCAFDFENESSAASEILFAWLTIHYSHCILKAALRFFKTRFLRMRSVRWLCSWSIWGFWEIGFALLRCKLVRSKRDLERLHQSWA